MHMILIWRVKFFGNLANLGLFLVSPYVLCLVEGCEPSTSLMAARSSAEGDDNADVVGQGACGPTDDSNKLIGYSGPDGCYIGRNAQITNWCDAAKNYFSDPDTYKAFSVRIADMTLDGEGGRQVVEMAYFHDLRDSKHLQWYFFPAEADKANALKLSLERELAGASSFQVVFTSLLAYQQLSKEMQGVFGRYTGLGFSYDNGTQSYWLSAAVRKSRGPCPAQSPLSLPRHDSVERLIWQYVNTLFEATVQQVQRFCGDKAVTFPNES